MARKKKDYNSSDVEVFYEGGTIDKTRVVIDINTGEVSRFNAVYLPEKPETVRVPKVKDFTRVFKVNKTGLITSRLLTISELGFLGIMESYVSWESNLLFDKDKEAYMTGTDISRISGISEKTALLTIKSMAQKGIITLIKAHRNERRIILNPHIAYQGEKIDKWILELFKSRPYKPILEIPFSLKTYVDNEGNISYYPFFVSSVVAL